MPHKHLPIPQNLPAGFQLSNNLYIVDTETRNLRARYNPYTPLHLIGLIHVNTQRFFTLSLGEFIEWEKEGEPYFIFHNAPFDVAVLRIRGAKIERFFDTQLAAAIWHGGSAENFSLETLGEQLGFPKMDLRKVLIDNGKLDPKADKGAEYYDATPEMVEYLYYDLRATLAVFFHYLELYSTDELAWKYLLNIEVPYIENILEMQSGTLIDREKLRDIQAALEDDLSDSWKALQGVLSTTGVFIHHDGETWLPDPTKKGTVDRGDAGRKVAGVWQYSHCLLRPYSPSNTADNIYILKKAYGWEPPDKTKAGNEKLDKYILEKLSGAGNEFAKYVLEYRELYKLSNTFVDGINDATDPHTNILYPEYCSVCTRTHRLSSRNPNLQNLPARSKTASKVRELFTVADDYVLAVADLDRIEAVLLGWWLLQLNEPDDRLAKVFIDRVDLHQTNADSWGISRFLAKTVLYLLMYGGGALRLSISAGISLAEAEKVFASVNDGMPALLTLKEWVADIATQNGGVIHDPLGNRYVIPELLSNQKWERAKGERLSFSYVNQGFAGSIFKELQIRLRSELIRQGVRAKQLLQVHDEVVYTVHKDDVERFKLIGDSIFTTMDILTTEGQYAIPVSGEFNTGKTWLEAK